MEDPGTERKNEAVERPADEEPVPPFGILAAILFVRLIAVVSSFVMVGVVLIALIHLTNGPFSKRTLPEAFLESIALVTASVVMIVMVTGAMWVDAILAGRTSSRAEKRGIHPARQMFIPVASGIAIYGVVAVLLWFSSLLRNDIARTWPWPVVWGTMGTGALFLCRHLNRVLPP